MEQIIEWGVSFNLWIEQFRSVPLTYLFTFFHHAGNKFGYMILIPIACFMKPKLAFPLIIAVLSSWLINIGLKEFFALPRPFVDGGTNALLTPNSYSFPSGHAQAAGLFWGFWLFRCKSIKQASIPILFISMIGFSRVYLGVHYFTDVIVGWLIGISLAYIAHRMCLRID